MLVKNKKILMQGQSSIKTLYWDNAARNQNLGTIQVVEGDTVKMFLLLIKKIVKKEKPDGIVFRYLNDSKSLLLTIMKTLSELLTVVIAKIFNISILWICHNVDKESVENYPFFIKLRRLNLKFNSDKIFVTDELLIDKCVEILGVSENKVSAISFGKPDIFPEYLNEDKMLKTKDKLYRIKDWVKNKQKQNKNFLFGLWIGSPSNKKYSGLTAILKILQEKDNDCCFIIIGKISTWLENKDPNFLKALQENERILMVDEMLEIPVSFWTEICDFLWKPYDDLSVPLTVYNSALVNIPLVAFDNTFLGDFIKKYRLGITVNPYSNIAMSEQLTNSLKNWQQDFSLQGGSDFLKLKTWENASQSLFKFVKN